MRPQTRGSLAILGSSLGYGTLAVLAKLALGRGVEVVPLLAWRFLIASAVLWGWVLLGGRRRPDRARAPGLVLLGGLYAGNSLAFMLGLDRIPASLASLVFFTYPAVTVLLARAWLGEALTRRRLGSLAATTVGCALTVGQGFAKVDAAGVALVLASVAILSVFIIASHGVLRDGPGPGGTALLLTVTGVLTALVALGSGGLGVPGDAGTIALLVALGIVATAIPVTLFLLGIQWVGPARAAIFSTLEPVVTIALATMVLNEHMTSVQLLGGVLILAGVVWLRLERNPAEDAPH